jgi:putative transposase
MARLSRLALAGHLHYVSQRGNNRQAIALSAADFGVLLKLMEETSRAAEVEIHAYAISTESFDLLATPKNADGLPVMMQALGRRYVRYFNDLHGRSGTLWEGRYRSTVLQADRYLLSAMSHMDLKPVRSGQGMEPAAYPWSSHGHYVGLRTDRIVTPHALIWLLGNTPFAREAAYAARVQKGLSPSEEVELTQAVAGGWALGDAGFVAELQGQTERRLTQVKSGRPGRARRNDY